MTRRIVEQMSGAPWTIAGLVWRRSRMTTGTRKRWTRRRSPTAVPTSRRTGHSPRTQCRSWTDARRGVAARPAVGTPCAARAARPVHSGARDLSSRAGRHRTADTTWSCRPPAADTPACRLHCARRAQRRAGEGVRKAPERSSTTRCPATGAERCFSRKPPVCGSSSSSSGSSSGSSWSSRWLRSHCRASNDDFAREVSCAGRWLPR
mmetsp:Transcript_38925/g.98117  ORF Transcript_38925/g.98117 Transcript_38925/m.98117 type:complete len:207 (+) Transcript_38925:672-1292(+)